MSEIDRIIDELQRAFEGEPWHGWPLTAILDGITAEHAASHRVPGAHSIWELVLHMTGWKREVRRRLGGAPAQEPEGGDWPEAGAASEARWREALADLARAHRELLEVVSAFPESRLPEPTHDPREPAGTGVSYYVLLHGIVQHDVYHAGQIAILKKSLGQGVATR